MNENERKWTHATTPLTTNDARKREMIAIRLAVERMVASDIHHNHIILGPDIGGGMYPVR